MNKTQIEWATMTWNPITGCSPVSEGCRNCYAARFAKRFRGRFGYPADDPFRVTFHEDRLMQPMHTKKPQRIFVCSMGDLFHDDVKTEWIDDILEVMSATPWHTYLVLTKRPENMWDKLYSVTSCNPCRELGCGDYLKNLWLGVTVENKAEVARIEPLLQIPAAVRFISVEPMLESVNLTKYLLHGLDWVICGAEKIPGRSNTGRECRPEWIDDLRHQCYMRNVPFFGKTDSFGDPIIPRYFPKAMQLGLLK